MSIACNIMLCPPSKEGSKSNIAAKFQNALSVHLLPPIGVFWDIENCQVPKGKSAIALVQKIRERFFANHREAEFMCVCDINKESKTVIQELILAQVTVVHISATSKNAADDKLKQCMRRFVDTHGTPSTLLLISDDVNFSSDLSDFRHRHNIRIILLHRGHTHPSLIACAHEHFEFSSVISDLPGRSPLKPSSRRPTLLVVKDLPTNRNAGQIKTLLRKLSVNCGGKVSEIKGTKAYIKFATADAAERAQKRMDKENVFGNEISVNFCHPAERGFSPSPSKINRYSHSSNDASDSSSSSRDSSASPAKIEDSKSDRKFDFPPPPVLDRQTCPLLLEKTFKESSLKGPSSVNTFQGSSNMEMIKDTVKFQVNWNQNRFKNNINANASDTSAFSNFKKETDCRVKYSQKNIGRVSPFVMHESDKNSRNTNSDANNLRCVTSQNGSISNSFLVNRAYQNSVQCVSSSFDIQRINDPYSYTSSWSRGAAITETAISVARNNPLPTIDDSSSIELYVSNLDPTFDVNEMKKILLSVFREHVMVLHISMTLQPDGSAKAIVKVPSLQDAQFAISRLHRKKIGHKRILISHVSLDKTVPFHILRSETIALLNDIPSKSLPIIKFRELYEKRYHRPIAVSELYKMKEAVTIHGDSGSRIVYLNSDYCSTPSLPDTEDSQECSVVEKPYCEVHFLISPSQGWAERYNICPLPFVHISLKTLATGVHRLLDSHHGSLPLISFCDCYEAEIGLMPITGHFASGSEESTDLSAASNQTSAGKQNKGVPLEHLIACIAGVEVSNSSLSIKKVQWMENKTAIQVPQNFNPVLMGQLNLFGREVIDLLKSQPQCLLAFKKFIPTYHHHFGRQCRVADYGFTKLIQLLEAIPHIVQVLGEGQNKQVTLTHRTQIKRFVAELLRILKSRASKQIIISEFAQAYEQVVEKPFEITNYGVCEIEDMLDEVPENVIVTSSSGTERIIAIPKREQTAEEIERTHQFAEEVIELMKHTTNCSMAFNKFIPSYHHHFGKQCRMADYGFTKLIELFEAIPSVLEVKGTGEEKVLKLVEIEQHKILVDRLVAVLKAQPGEMIEINQLCHAYALIFGHVLRPVDFGFSDLNEVLKKLNTSFKVVNQFRKQYVCLLSPDFLHRLSLNIKRLLMEQKGGKMAIEELNLLYEKRYGAEIDLTDIFKIISDVVQMTDNTLELTPLQLFARDLIILLQENYFQIPLSNISSLFHQKYGVPIYFNEYDFSNWWDKLQQLSEYFLIRGKRNKRYVHLHPDIIENPLPDCHSLSSGNYEGKHIDLLNEPVPSCVPSPCIEPAIRDRWENLMGFETPPVQDIFCVAEPLFQSSQKKCSKMLCTKVPNSSAAGMCFGSENHFNQKRTSQLSCSALPFQTCCNSLPPVNQSYANQAATENFHPCKSANQPVIGFPNQSVTQWQSKPNVINSSPKPDFSEPLASKDETRTTSPECSSLSVGVNPSSSISAKVDSTENVSDCDSKLNRRNRIAAQFSVPIKE